MAHRLCLIICLVALSSNGWAIQPYSTKPRPTDLSQPETVDAFFERIGVPPINMPMAGYPQNGHVSPDLWQKLSPYFLPHSHPARRKLDKIFSDHRRVLENITSLKNAGFKHPKARQWTRLIVTTHKDLKGYVVKLYTDSQHPHRKRPEWQFWVSRIKGVGLIQQLIEEKGWQHTFKTPKKWIYPVPEYPAPSPAAKYRKNFILIEEDMNILSDEKNEAKWRSHAITKEMLDKLFTILQTVGLWDCAKPANIPFGKDGRIAFLDTQTYHTWPVKLSRLTPFLSHDIQPYWDTLIHDYTAH